MNDVSLSVAKGEVLALIGQSGSGKTTLALAALGLVRPGLAVQEGQVRVCGTDMFRSAPRTVHGMRGRTVAYVAQSAAAAFNPRIRLDEQVTEPARIHRTRGRRDALARARDLYARLSLPDPQRMGRRFPFQVSGGQLQRFMIAMAMIEEPALLVCDEPTSALDATTQVGLLRTLKQQIRERQATVLFVSHDLAVVAQIADRIAVLHNGVLVEEGETAALLAAPQRDYTRQLVSAFNALSVTRTARRPAPAADGAPLLSVRGVSAGYGRGWGGGLLVPVLRDVDLDLHRGQVVGIIGESGSGKSTLAKVVAGLHRPAAGTLSFEGQALAPTVARRSLVLRQRIQLVLQSADTALNARHSVGRILGRILHFHLGLSGAEADRRIAELLAMVELPAAFAQRLPTELSGGEKQRVNLARALAAEPAMLICDEIISALDTLVAAAIVRLVDGLRTRLGLGVLFITHDLGTMAAISDRLLVMRQGRVVEAGATGQVLEAPAHPYTRLLLHSAPELRPGWLEEADAAQQALSQALAAA